MTTTETLDAVVLHVLRLKGRSAEHGIAVATGTNDAAVHAVLGRCSRDGLVLLRTGRMSGWSLTPDGRRRADEVLAAERASTDLSRAAALYDEVFLGLNSRFKQLLADWQLAGAEAEAVPTGLPELHVTTLDLVAGLAVPLARLARYADRFTAAYERVLEGNRNAVARPLTDSYHDVWMDLHQDLLLVLDRERAEDD